VIFAKTAAPESRKLSIYFPMKFVRINRNIKKTLNRPRSARVWPKFRDERLQEYNYVFSLLDETSN